MRDGPGVRVPAGPFPHLTRTTGAVPGGQGLDGFEEHFPTDLGVWLPGPRHPHASEVLPPRVAPPRRGGPAYTPARRRPHLGLSVPPPLVRVGYVVRRRPWERAALLAGVFATAAGAAVALLTAVPTAGPGVLVWAPVLLALFAVAFALAAPRVSYRSRDVLLLLVPLLNIALACRVAWRVTALPDRPWPPRVDELAPPLEHRPGAAAPEIDIWDRG